MITSYTVKMLRSVERVLPGGERETLSVGQHYTLDAASAAPFLSPTTVTREVNGAAEQVELPPAAEIVETYWVPESPEEQEALAATDAAPTPAPVGEDEE